MASMTLTISDEDYNDIVKPVMIEMLDYENQKLEGETENQFIKRMTGKKLNRWIKGLRLQKQKKNAVIITDEDIFN